jgi:hypothetical protein
MAQAGMAEGNRVINERRRKKFFEARKTNRLRARKMKKFMHAVEIEKFFVVIIDGRKVHRQRMSSVETAKINL